MGVLNLTPDSFSDGGRFLSPTSAIDAAWQMHADGADLLDLGPESTRPGSARIPADIQLSRLLPVLTELSRQNFPLPLSLDTTLSAVARPALDLGISLLNDISAGQDDPEMLPLAASRNTPIVLMHMQGTPATMQLDPTYTDVVAEVITFLRHRLDAALQAGIPPENLLIDPGIGFGKTTGHNVALLHHLRQIKSELPQAAGGLLVGTSRKRFLSVLAGHPDTPPVPSAPSAPSAPPTSPQSRLFATAASVALATANGADILRVHDVAPMRDVLRVAHALSNPLPP
jgi:dihydropteroate synthase